MAKAKKVLMLDNPRPSGAQLMELMNHNPLDPISIAGVKGKFLLGKPPMLRFTRNHVYLDDELELIPING